MKDPFILADTLTQVIQDIVFDTYTPGAFTRGQIVTDNGALWVATTAGSSAAVDDGFLKGPYTLDVQSKVYVVDSDTELDTVSADFRVYIFPFDRQFTESTRIGNRVTDRIRILMIQAPTRDVTAEVILAHRLAVEPFLPTNKIRFSGWWPKYPMDVGRVADPDFLFEMKKFVSGATHVYQTDV